MSGKRPRSNIGEHQSQNFYTYENDTHDSRSPSKRLALAQKRVTESDRLGGGVTVSHTPSSRMSPSSALGRFGCTESSPYASEKLSGLREMAFEREIEVLQVELQREKNERRLDRIKAEQTENRLKRQVEWLSQEAEETRNLLDEVRDQAEKDVENLKTSRQKVVLNLRDAEQKILKLSFQHSESGRNYHTSDLSDTEGGDSDEDNFWKKRNEFLVKKLQAVEEEVQNLREFKHGENSTPTVNTASSQHETQYPVLSDAPPEVLSELHRTRHELNEEKRRHRIECSKSKELESQIKVARPKVAQLQIVLEQKSSLENQVKSLRKENELNTVLEKEWILFREAFERKFELSSTGDSIRLRVDDENDSNSKNRKMKSKQPIELATVTRCFQNLHDRLSKCQGNLSTTQSQLKVSKGRIQQLEAELKANEMKIQESSQKLKHAKDELLCSTMEIKKCQAQESIWKQESESMSLLVNSYDSMLESPGKANSRNPSGTNESLLRINLDTAKDQIAALNKSLSEMKDQMDKLLKEKKSTDEELIRVKEKFGKIREAIMKERDLAERAEERAVRAETLVGKGAYNIETTKVLHLQANPLSGAIREKYEKEVSNLKKEIEFLRASRNNSGDSPASSGSSLDRSFSSRQSVDAQKLHTRLKEGFKEQICLFREGVHLLTGECNDQFLLCYQVSDVFILYLTKIGKLRKIGFKIDMITTSGKPQFKVRSMFSQVRYLATEIKYTL